MNPDHDPEGGDGAPCQECAGVTRTQLAAAVTVGMVVGIGVCYVLVRGSRGR